MPRRDQAATGAGRRAFVCARRIGLLTLLAGLAAGCSITSLGVGGKPDSTVVTGSITPPPAPAPQDEDAADAKTVLDAVSSAALDDIAGGKIPWQNVATGSRGEIAGIEERRQEGLVCRSFSSSRESYRGVALYRGEACLTPAGGWWMRRLDAV